MPTLAFAIEADYEEVIRLRKELNAIEQQLASIDSTKSPEVFNKLEERAGKLHARLDKLIDKAAQAGAKFEEQGIKMKGSMELSSGATKALLAQLDELSKRSITQEKLTDAFKEQTAAVSSLRTQISQLSFGSEDYASKAARIKTEIEGMSSALRKDVSAGLGSDEQKQRLTEINAKIGEYASAVTQASAMAKAAYELQQNSIVALSSEIEALKKSQVEAAASGDAWASSRIQDQINVLNGHLQQAERNLAKMGDQAKQTEQALADVGKTQNSMRADSRMADGFFGNVIDSVTAFKNRVTGMVDNMKESVQQRATSMFEPIRNFAGKASDEISQKWSTLSDKMGVGRLNQALQSAGETINGYKNKLMDAATGHGKFQESLGNMKTALNGLPIPLGSTITSIQKMGKAMWALCSTPLGAVLAAIALALQAVHQYFNKSAEGQKAFAKISAYTGSLLQSVTDVVMILGKWLYHAFADNTGPMNNFGKSLVKTFSTAVKTVADLFKGLGKTIKGVLSLDMATIWEGMKDIGSSLAGAVKTAFSVVETSMQATVAGFKTAKSLFTDDKLANDLGKAFDDAGKKAKIAADLAAKETQATREMAEAKQKAAKLDIEIAEKRDKIYTLTGKAKKELAEEVKLLQKQRYEGQIAAQQKLLSVQKERNRIHTTTLKDIAKERDLQTSVYELQAQQMASTRMMTRMAAMAGRQEERNAKNAVKAAATAANKDRNQANALTSANEKFAQVERTNAVNRAAEAVKLEESITDARIAAMRDGADKVKAERARELEKELVQLDQQRQAAINAEIKRQKDEWDAQQAVVKAQGGRIQEFSITEEDLKNDPAFKQINEAYDKLANFTRQKHQLAEQMAESQAMRDYLKEYGTYQQQKLAIAEEYAEKIAKAEAAGETMTARSLEKERDSKVASIDAKSLAMDIDWSQSFQGVGKVLNGIATETLKKVEAFMKTADFKKLGASDKKSYVDLRNQLRQQGADKGSNPFNFGIWKEVEQDMVNYQNAVRNLASATEAEKQAIEEVKAAQQQLAQASTDQEKKIAKDRLLTAQANASVASVNTQGAQDKKDEANDRLVASTNRAQAGIEGFVGAINRMKSGSLYDFYAGIVDLVNCFKDLANASSEVGQAVDGLSAVSNAASGTTEALGATTEALGAATDALSEGAAQALGDVGTKAIGEASQAAGQAIAQAGEAGGQAIQQATDTVANGVSNAGIWGKIIGAILQLLDVFAEDFDGFVTGLVDKIGKAVKGILEDLPRITQELPKIIFDLIKNIFEGIAESMVNSFTFDSVFGFNKEDDLKKSNEKLAEQNKSLESAVSDLKDEMKKGNGGKQSVDAYRDAVEKQKRQIENSRQQWKNSMGENSTFHSSSNYKLNEDKRWVSAVNNALARYAENNKAKGVQKKTVDSAEALQMLSPEELKAIKDYALDTWDDIKTWGHYYDPDKWEEMVSYAGKLEELTDSFQETLTGTSFDGFRDNFIDALMDMDASSQDFANNFQKQLTEAAMKQTITQELGGRIKSLYSKWADAAESGTQLSDAEVEALMKEQADITEDAMKLREQIFELTGYNGDKSTNASTGSFQGMSQDTGNELNGRFTALQAAGERIDANVAEQTKSLLQMNVTLGELVGKTTESISIADETRDIIANSYIELQEINLNTKQTVVALKTTNDRLQRIENKL